MSFLIFVNSVIDRGADIIIHRVLVGSYIDKLGLLKRGDIIREVNNREFNSAGDLQEYIAQTNGSLVFKLAVKIDADEVPSTTTPFIKAYFSYRPDRDNLLPEKSVGVPFVSGDVLQGSA